MNKLAGIFLVTQLLLTLNLLAQRDKVYKSLDAALEAGPEMVYQIDLSGKRLKEVPSELKSFTNLNSIDLSRNKITELPNWFVFQDLKYLNLERNKISVFPEVICQNKKLQFLKLGRNTIGIVPSCIKELIYLRELELWFNPIEDLPKEMAELRNLRYVDLKGVFFDDAFKEKWAILMPWVNFEFEAGCDCAK